MSAYKGTEETGMKKLFKKRDKFQPRERRHLENPLKGGRILFCNTSIGSTRAAT
jgi:hypothetical protein